MRITMFITEEIAQFNLIPENEHEKKFVKIMSNYRGSAEIHHAINIEECRGGYLRNFNDNDETVAVVLRRPE